VDTPGIDGVLLGNDWGSQRDMLMSPKVWRELLAPGAKREYDVIREAGLDVWIHSCGNIRQIIPDLIDMGAQVLNPIQPECMDVYELKDTFGNRMTFWGGISTQQTLPFGTEEDVEAETRRVTAYMSRGGGYILAAGQGIQADVPFENLCRLVDVANEMDG
jgi:uroporphyrinogen decarboxylase